LQRKMLIGAGGLGAGAALAPSPGRMWQNMDEGSRMMTGWS
jgi:hypothetical protein